VLELRLDREARRWITRNLEGPNAGAEIWTHVFEVADRVLDIVVDFFVPGVPEVARDKVGMAYARAYELLYDEDVAMMAERQRQLDRRLDGIDDAEEVDLGPIEALSLPVTVTLSGRAFVINSLVGVSATEAADWVVYPAQCPHQLGPLEQQPLVNGTVRCPWHGYVFDVKTGACISGSHCQLGQVPDLVVESGRLILRWTSQG
jgi:nitrite reductase/ring-hydroxylating ferredoxin subunit